MKGRPTGFWGKLERDGSGVVTEWHPLPAHCADVSACTEALLERTVLRCRLAALGGRAGRSSGTAPRRTTSGLFTRRAVDLWLQAHSPVDGPWPAPSRRPRPAHKLVCRA
ncbi:MAG: hypothetical protein HYY06_30880 [Deltaproteobacteria bacterium]|nr:hypothetical protein [Deltaproteobacteria bacterium]